MNKGQKIVAGLLGVVVAELAVLDYAAYQMMKNGINVEVTQEELIEAGEVALQDMIEEGE